MSRLNIGTCAQPYRLMENVSLIRSNHFVSPHFQESSLSKLLENCEDPHVHTISSMSQTETHVGSIDGQEHEEVQKKVKSRRPASTLTPMAHRFVQRNEDIVQRLMRYSALYRYRLPATAVESMAVSASPSPRRRFQAQQQVPLLNIPLHRPILTPKTVLPLFFAVGIIFAPIGGLLLYASAQVSDHSPSLKLPQLVLIVSTLRYKK